MGLLDREWFKDAWSQNHGPVPTDRKASGRPEKQHRSTKPEDLTKAPNVPPAHPVLSARYEELKQRNRSPRDVYAV